MITEDKINRLRMSRIPLETLAYVLRRADDLCEDCGERLLGGGEFHHLTYLRRGREYPSDLALLCRDCHQARHIGPDGSFHRDPWDCRRAWEEWDRFRRGISWDREFEEPEQIANYLRGDDRR